MQTIMNTQPTPSQQPSTVLMGKQIDMSDLNKSHKNFLDKPKDKVSASMDSYLMNANKKVNNQQRKDEK